MQILIRRLFTGATCLLLALGGMVASAGPASAQATETTEVLESGETLVTSTLITNNGNDTIVTETLISADGCRATITTTTTSVVSNSAPVIPFEEYEGRGGSAPASRPTLITDVTTTEEERSCSPPLTLDDPGDPADPDEVLGEVVLATTGSDIDVPIAVGAGLIGVGGLLVAAAAKRRHKATD